MTLKIGYDARMIENSGIGIRIQHILKYWPLDETEVSLFVFGDPNVLSSYSLPSFAKIVDYTPKIYSLAEMKGHPLMGDMDILDIPHFNIPLKYIHKCIVTIHDLIPYHFKNAHGSLAKRIYIHFVLRLIKWFSKKIITVSEFTKQDLIKEFNFSNEKIDVIYNGVDLKSFRSQSLENVKKFRKKYNLPEEFLFTVGIGKAHKNFPFLLSSLEELWLTKNLSIPLVIGGISKEIPEELIEFQKKHKDRLFFLPHLSYSELPLAYQASLLFLFPSLYEGFGFPVLEAQAVGTPVLSSNASVLPEILLDSAEYFDPKNENDFKSKINYLLKDKKKSKKLENLGYRNADRFQWKFAIEKLKSLYEKELNHLTI